MRTHTFEQFAAGSVLFLFSTCVWAQEGGSIAGVVRDGTGAVLPGVTVEVSSPALIERTRSVVSDGQGQYKVVELRAGTYSVTFTLAGFNSVKREGVQLSTGFTATINAVMEVGAVQETVTVTGASPVVDVQSTRTQQVLESSFLESLPYSKTFGAFNNMIPSVISTSSLSARDVGGTAGEPAIGSRVHGSDAGLTSIDGIKIVAMATANWRQLNANVLTTIETVVELGNGDAEAWTGGVNINVVSKDGGNTFSGTIQGDYIGEGWDASNLNDALRARGLSRTNKQAFLYDTGAGFGGPLVKNRLWFYGAPRFWGNKYYIAGNYYNKLAHTLFYEADLSRPAYFNRAQWGGDGRVIWQVAQEHKLIVQSNNGDECFCPIGPDTGGTTPEGGWNYHYSPQHLIRGTWTYTPTNRLLVEVGGAYRQDDVRATFSDGVLATDRSVIDQADGRTYGVSFAGAGWAAAFQTIPSRQKIARMAVNYVTGSHAFKTGFSTLTANQSLGGKGTNLDGMLNYPEQYVFRNRIPISLNQAATPNRQETRLKLALGIFAQDRWTVRRLTLNLGLRFDGVNAYSPAQVRPGGEYTPELSLPLEENIPNWKGLHPRVGASYDLFGTGRTAIKASLGQYEQSNNYGLTFARANAAFGSLVLITGRTWNDSLYPVGDPRNGNYVPDCDLHDKGANGECGALADQSFGSERRSTQYTADVKEGWGKSPNLWQTQLSLQHELAPNVGLTVGYFRTWYRNIYLTDNLAVTQGDYSPYCVTAPKDDRLPGGGGYQVCGLYDVSRERFGQVQNLVTFAPDRSQGYDGLDFLVNARFRGGASLYGGLSTGQTVTDNCATPDVPQQFCRQMLPWRGQTHLKLSGVYSLPWWGIQASATYQNLSGTARAATAVFTNAEIVSSLGRNLASCPNLTGACNATATVTIVEPNTMFEPRQNQLDARFSKIFRFGRGRLRGNFDVYNLTNSAPVLSMITRYGATWLSPNSILAGRLMKVGAQLDF